MTAILRPGFRETLRRHGLSLRRKPLRILQINVGKRCNQTCVHCHVGAGPKRPEILTAPVADRCIAWMRRHRPEIVDLTGGAPELCPEFRRLAVAARAAGARVLVRCNLTVLFEPGQEDLPGFYREHALELVCSLPCYGKENVDFQRGDGVFEKSIRALRRLNDEGYGEGDEFPLDLVYNPVGAALPPPQDALQRDYKRHLEEEHGISFRRLICIANVPITRFAGFLQRRGEAERYDELLRASFNPETVGGLMCRDTLSVDWTGKLYDCDFNQMRDLPLGERKTRYLWDVDPEELEGEAIATAGHCFACTAGCGSSCAGSLL